MPQIRKITVPLSGHEIDEPVLDTAFAVAKRFDANLRAALILADPRDAVAFVGEGMTSAMLEQIMLSAESEGKDRAGKTRVLFETLRQRYGCPDILPPAGSGFGCHYFERVGREDEIVAQRGRLCDLLVAGRVRTNDANAPHLALEAALRETGRPVLVVSSNVPPDFGKTIAIAWNGSIEVSRAIIMGMPFLERAERVVVLSVEGDTEYGPPGSDLLEYLGWHGITGQAVAVKSSERGQGQALLAAAESARADLMIMGAYTRSHMRRLIFGGVTAYMLDHAPFPLLMTH